jgi:hypothetical protein
MILGVLLHDLLHPLFLHLALLSIHLIWALEVILQLNRLIHTRATNLLSVFNKAMGNKRHRLSGDMAFAFKKLTKSSKKIKTLKLELQREAIETTKSIAQSMIGMGKWSRKKVENKLYNWHNFL